MKHIVTVTFDGSETKCDPARLQLDEGDTVQWVCPQGDLRLDFARETPFTSTQVWKANRGDLTAEAIVTPQLPKGAVYRPTISVNGTVVARSLGDVIIRAGT